MTFTPKSALSAASLLIGGFIGASVLVALAQSASTWTSAPGTPSNCPTGYPGCDAPLNVALNIQQKLGSLILNANTAGQVQNAIGLTVFGTSTFNGSIQVNSGSPKPGQVLTAVDTSGTAAWTNAGVSSGGGFSNNYRAGTFSEPSGAGPFHVTFSSPFPSGTNVVVTTSQNGAVASGYFAVQQAGVRNITASGFDVVFAMGMNPATYTYIAVPAQ